MLRPCIRCIRCIRVAYGLHTERKRVSIQSEGAFSSAYVFLYALIFSFEKKEEDWERTDSPEADGAQ